MCVTVAGRSSTVTITGRLVAIKVAASSTLLKVLVLKKISFNTNMMMVQIFFRYC